MHVLSCSLPYNLLVKSTIIPELTSLSSLLSSPLVLQKYPKLNIALTTNEYTSPSTLATFRETSYAFVEFNIKTHHLKSTIYSDGAQGFLGHQTLADITVI